MAKFKVGQRVRVGVVSELQNYKGKIIEIRQKGSGYYYLVSFHGIERWLCEWGLEAVGDG